MDKQELRKKLKAAVYEPVPQKIQVIHSTMTSLLANKQSIETEQYRLSKSLTGRVTLFDKFRTNIILQIQSDDTDKIKPTRPTGRRFFAPAKPRDISEAILALEFLVVKELSNDQRRETIL